MDDVGARPSLAGYLAQVLPEYGVTHVFELIGGMITVMLDAMNQNPELTVVTTHHEQGAGFAAEGLARMTGQPAVAMGTSGPGATNLLTAIGSCYFDSVPVVFITGQVNLFEMRQEGQGRQGGFQETDIVAMAAPVTKMSVLVEDAEQFPALLREAFEVATSGRPGPVLLDIPMDVQRQAVGPDPAPQQIKASTVSEPARAFLHDLTESVASARRPLAIIGGGVRCAQATDALTAALDQLRLPAVVSLMGVDALPDTSPWRVGFLGSYGNRWANAAVAAADVLVVLGSRLDVRQTGSDVEGFRGDRRIFHIDVDPGELDNHVLGARTLAANLADALPVIAAGPAVSADRDAWLAELAELRNRWPDDAENVPPAGVNPNRAVHEILTQWPDLGAVVTDVGQHQMWAAQSVQLRHGQRFLTSGGMGSMGFGLPAAIGAAMATDGAPVCLIAGDGGFQCNLQELQTLVRQGLPVRIVVFDNESQGMVRQFQQSYFNERYYGTVWGYSAPDFAEVARAFGLAARSATTHAELAGALADMADLTGPCLIHLKIDSSLNAYPKMAFGQPYGSMEPDVQPTEMEGT